MRSGAASQRLLLGAASGHRRPHRRAARAARHGGVGMIAALSWRQPSSHAVATPDWDRNPVDPVPKRRYRGLELPDAFPSHQKRTGDALFPHGEYQGRGHLENARSWDLHRGDPAWAISFGALCTPSLDPRLPLFLAPLPIVDGVFAIEIVLIPAGHLPRPCGLTGGGRRREPRETMGGAVDPSHDERPGYGDGYQGCGGANRVSPSRRSPASGTGRDGRWLANW